MNPVILCIDDQREVLAALLKDLNRLADNYDLLDCESAAEARELIGDLCDDGQAIAMIVTDHVMPQQNGLDFLFSVCKWPELAATKFVLLTGYAAHEDIVQAHSSFLDGVLTKPWRQDTLLQTVTNLLPEAIAAGVES